MSNNKTAVVRINDRKAFMLPRKIRPLELEMHYMKTEQEATTFASALVGVKHSIDKLGTQWCVLILRDVNEK